MTHHEQLQEWVKGNSVHNETTGECCPDFSCCVPELAIPVEQRILFQKADDKLRMEMLGIFLGAAIAKYFEEKGQDKKVYIAGLEQGMEQ